MKACPRCGGSNPDAAVHCERCGSELPTLPRARTDPSLPPVTLSTPGGTHPVATRVPPPGKPALARVLVTLAAAAALVLIATCFLRERAELPRPQVADSTGRAAQPPGRP